MKCIPGPKWGRTYDDFFASHAPVNRIQFVGLLVLGTALIMCGLYLLLLILSKNPLSSMDPTAFAILFIPFCICAAIIYFGILHFRRAFTGRK